MSQLIYPGGKELTVPTVQVARWTPRAGLDVIEKRKILPLPGIEPQLSSLYPIDTLTELQK
jgi:hypothetical protein